jgi:hypothetical protein
MAYLQFNSMNYLTLFLITPPHTPVVPFRYGTYGCNFYALGAARGHLICGSDILLSAVS